MNKKVEEYLESPEFKESLNVYCEKLNKDLMREDRFIDAIIKRIEPLSNPEFIKLVVRLCEWETLYEERFYKRGIKTTSKLFFTFFEAVSQCGGARPVTEMFLSEKYIYKGLTFKLYIGQGSFYRITMGKRLIFQSK